MQRRPSRVEIQPARDQDPVREPSSKARWPFEDRLSDVHSGLPRKGPRLVWRNLLKMSPFKMSLWRVLDAFASAPGPAMPKEQGPRSRSMRFYISRLHPQCFCIDD